ncbi:MAG TPA: hypothetical protein VGQ51_00060 [Puia sp.]|jgi:hypothetical protein|nr:hypothetical protein [Puia sp.]
MLAEIFLLVIVFYLLYRFVFNFLLPIVKTTRHVRQQFRNMQDSAGEQRQQPKNWQDRHSTTKGAAEDYIEFEDIK